MIRPTKKHSESVTVIPTKANVDVDIKLTDINIVLISLILF